MDDVKQLEECRGEMRGWRHKSARPTGLLHLLKMLDHPTYNVLKCSGENTVLPPL